MKVEFTDGTKETYKAKEIAQRIRMRKKTTMASVFIIARDYASSQGSFCGAYFRGVVRSVNSMEKKPEVTTQDWELLV